jgi:hypothetical protein
MQIVGLLLTKAANTQYKNAYGNTPLKVAKDKTCGEYIKRVQVGAPTCGRHMPWEHARIMSLICLMGLPQAETRCSEPPRAVRRLQGDINGWALMATACWLHCLTQDGGEPERLRLAEELKSLEEASKREAEEQQAAEEEK